MQAEQHQQPQQQLRQRQCNLTKRVNTNMYVMELFDPAAPGYRSEEDDNSVQHLKDLRKTKLTLAHLNKLRMANDVRKFEHEDKLKKVSKQYKAAAEPGAAGGMPAGI